MQAPLLRVAAVFAAYALVAVAGISGDKFDQVMADEYPDALQGFQHPKVQKGKDGPASAKVEQPKDITKPQQTAAETKKPDSAKPKQMSKKPETALEKLESMIQEPKSKMPKKDWEDSAKPRQMSKKLERVIEIALKKLEAMVQKPKSKMPKKDQEIEGLLPADIVKRIEGPELGESNSEGPDLGESNSTWSRGDACVDNPGWLKDCQHIQEHCQDYQSMKINCAKSCGHCTPSNTTTPSFEDTQTQNLADEMATNLGETNVVPAEIIEKIRSTVNLLGESNSTWSRGDACIDNPGWVKDCQHIKEHCQDYQSMKVHCAKSCGHCTPSNTTTPSESWTAEDTGDVTLMEALDSASDAEDNVDSLNHVIAELHAATMKFH